MSELMTSFLHMKAIDCANSAFIIVYPKLLQRIYDAVLYYPVGESYSLRSNTSSSCSSPFREGCYSSNLGSCGSF